MITSLWAQDVAVSWDENDESDLAGYKIYLGRASKVYDGIVDVGKETNFTFHRLYDEFAGQTIFFAITAYDYAGNESDFSDEVNITLASRNTNRPELIAATVRGETQIDVAFSETLDRESAENEANYNISGGIQVAGALLDSDGTTVHLITSPHELGTTYMLMVSGVKDRDGNAVASGSATDYTLPDPPEEPPPSSTDTTPPQLVNIAVVDTAHIDVFFSEAVRRNSAERGANYAIDSDISVLSVQLLGNETVVRLTTSAHQNGSYRLTVNNIEDKAATPNKIADNSSLSYEVDLDIPGGGSADTQPPTLLEIVVNGATQIDLKFDEPLAEASAENKNNYAIVPGLEVLGAVLNKDQRTVHLITVSHSGDVPYAVTVNNILDLANPPNTIEANSVLPYSYTPVVEFPDPPPPEEPDGDPRSKPRSFALFQNYPNPFNPETEIRFFLEKQREVVLKVYNAIGQVVKTLVNEMINPGYHTVLWDGKNAVNNQVPTGVYFYSLEVKRDALKDDLLVDFALERRVKRMTLIR
jgi:hypothetical protein